MHKAYKGIYVPLVLGYKYHDLYLFSDTGLECHNSFKYGINCIKEMLLHQQSSSKFNLFIGLISGDTNPDYIPIGLMDITNGRYELPKDMSKWTKKLLHLYGREVDTTSLELSEVELGILDNIAEEVSSSEHEYCQQTSCVKVSGGIKIKNTLSPNVSAHPFSKYLSKYFSHCHHLDINNRLE